MVYGALLSSLIKVKLLLVPLPCKGSLISGLSPPPNTLVLKTASPNFEGGFIIPISNKLPGCGISVFP